MRRVLAVWVALCAATAAAASIADPELDERAQGAHRVENEYKLSVPDAELEPLREFLRRRYASGDGSIFPELGPEFAATISDEAFLDRYFDTKKLDVLHGEGGVRYRTRHNLGDATKDRKHGRELVQLKLRRPGDQLLNRTEVKFEVNPPRNAKSPLDRHPLIGLVDRDEQMAFIRTMSDYGLDASRMQPTLTVEQRRWRVYVTRQGNPFATLTLDEVKSNWSFWNVAFVELEIELNEIAYTEADEASRGEMETLTRRMKDDILATFPAVRQDQTPKYNKVYNAFSHKLPRFDLLVVSDPKPVAALALALLVVGGVVVFGTARRVIGRRGAKPSLQKA